MRGLVQASGFGVLSDACNKVVHVFRSGTHACTEEGKATGSLKVVQRVWLTNGLEGSLDDAGIVQGRPGGML